MNNTQKSHYWYVFGTLIPCEKSHADLSEFIQICALSAAYHQRRCNNHEERQTAFNSSMHKLVSLVLTQPEHIQQFRQDFEHYLTQLAEDNKTYIAVPFNALHIQPQPDPVHAKLCAHLHAFNMMGLEMLALSPAGREACFKPELNQNKSELDNLFEQVSLQNSEAELENFKSIFWAHYAQIHEKAIFDQKHCLYQNQKSHWFTYTIGYILVIVIIALITTNLGNPQFRTTLINGEAVHIRTQPVKIQPLNGQQNLPASQDNSSKTETIQK